MFLRDKTIYNVGNFLILCFYDDDVHEFLGLVWFFLEIKMAWMKLPQNRNGKQKWNVKLPWFYYQEHALGVQVIITNENNKHLM
jgi:hypothetical protein